MFPTAYRSSSGSPNCISSLWFIYPCGDRPLSRLGGNSLSSHPAWTTAGHHMGTETRGWIYSLELLMMSGMTLERCWAFNKFWNNKFYYKVASCWLFILIHTTRSYQDLNPRLWCDKLAFNFPSNLMPMLSLTSMHTVISWISINKKTTYHVTSNNMSCYFKQHAMLLQTPTRYKQSVTPNLNSDVAIVTRNSIPALQYLRF